jgi:1-acyl-sn-glycerol-3-phosphate acyltransferase
MDIFVLNARTRAYFVAKSEVSTWPLIGMIARSVGTVFIERRSIKAASQKAVFSERLKLGQRLLFFPEGTSTDGQQVLPFRSSLFAAFFDVGAKEHSYIQPVAIRYQGPLGGDPVFYGWWGGMDFAPHFIAVLAAKKQGSVTVSFQPPRKIEEAGDRKTLCKQAELAVRTGFENSI